MSVRAGDIKTGVEVSFERREVRSPTNNKRSADSPQLTSDRMSGMSAMQTMATSITSATAEGQCEGDLLAVGGFVDSSDRLGSSQAQRLCCDLQKWEKLSEIPETRLNFAAAFLKGRLYICGGYDPFYSEQGTRATTDTFRFDPVQRIWERGGRMLYARAFHAVCVLEGRLFALGGHDQEERALKTVEVYDPEADRWSLVCSMDHCRVGASAAAFRGRLMVVGGYGRSSSSPDEPCPVLISTEWFEPEINRWQTQGSLRLPRAQACLVALDSYVYLCGGATRHPFTGVLCSIPDIDLYNPDSNQWLHVTDLHIARHNAGATALGSKIYVVGGVSTVINRVLRSVECFDTASGKWDTTLPELPLGAKSVACVVISG